MDRESFGIGIVNVKHRVNVGALLRAANNFNAAFVFTIGKRYTLNCTDTGKTHRHVPLFHCSSMDELENVTPYGWPRVCVELCDNAIDIRQYHHLKRCVYILGPEDGDVPLVIQKQCHTKIVLPTKGCMNVGVAAAVVMYDRLIKTTPPNNG